jgi:hypothetical protein
MIKRSIHKEYVSILKSPSTQPSGTIWGFEMASNIIATTMNPYRRWGGVSIFKKEQREVQPKEDTR